MDESIDSLIDLSWLIPYHWEIWVRFSVQYSFSFTFSDFCVPQLLYTKSIQKVSPIQSLFHSNPLFPHFLSSFPLPPTSTVHRMHMQLTVKASPLLFHNFLVNWSVFQFKFLYRRNHISKSILSYHSCFIMKFLFFCFIASLIIASHAEESVDVVLGLVGRVIGAVFFQSHSSADPSP